MVSWAPYINRPYIGPAYHVPYMVDRIWLIDHIWSKIRPTIYGHQNHIWYIWSKIYPTIYGQQNHIWATPYMVAHIWSWIWIIYGTRPYMVATVYDYHICFCSMGTIYGRFWTIYGPFFTYRIWFIWPYMTTIYGNVRIWFHIWSCLPFRWDSRILSISKVHDKQTHDTWHKLRLLFNK